MKKTEKLFQLIKESRLIALLTPERAEECLTAYEIFSSEGIVLEMALRSEHAVGGIELVMQRYPEALLLAGTVMTAHQAEIALQAGASGIVSADYIPEVVDVCVDSDIMCIPGGISDAGKQLVRKAARYGCPLEELKSRYPYQWIYKLFPAFTGTTSNMSLARAWRGPYEGLLVVYTGGISLDKFAGALESDADGIFCASALTKHINNPELMREEVRKWKALLSTGDRPVAERKSPVGSSRAPAKRIVTFGELMARLSPPAGIRLQQTRSFDLHFGGAEANVAVSLAQFGLNSAFVTALPDNELGDNALDTLRGLGVDTSNILRKGTRMGIYYLEHGSGPRPSKVVYDRSHSAFSEIAPEDLDWDRIFEGAGWFHWTGITPALGDSVADTLRTALKAARKRGVTISADLNYRKKLWTKEKAKQVMSELVPYVDVLIANEEDPTAVFDLKPEGTNIERGEIGPEGYREVAEQLVKMFGCEKVAITLRGSISASENKWSACLFDGKNFLLSPVHHVWIVDRVGAGDAFAAGLIYGILNGMEDSEALNFGAAASCLKHSVFGDFNLVKVSEVERLAAGISSGRVQR